MYELRKQFYFEAAHTLERSIDSEPSRRIHGHSYRAEVVVRGSVDPDRGMLIDLGILERALSEARAELDHRFLDEIEDLGPATMENLCAWIWRRVQPRLTSLARVTVHRDSSGESCSFFGEDGAVRFDTNAFEPRCSVSNGQLLDAAVNG